MAKASTEAGILAAADDLARRCDAMRFGGAVAYVYNPLTYARAGHSAYVERFASSRRRIVLVGMNPGPFGMAQTGVPFGHVGFVRDWMKIDARIERPAHEHPKRPVLGFACTRSEVSGARLWGWAEARFGPAPSFFRDFLVLNYCPLAFVEESGRNLTPDKLAASERAALFAACDETLARCVDALEPEWLIGIGGFAAGRVAGLAESRAIGTGAVPHPSPASPAANRGWNAAMESALTNLGVELP
jgi:single-strand selective monofunctional uracil DNA glycosylase